MTMDLLENPPKKCRKSLDSNLCLLCNKTVNGNKPDQVVLKPTKEGLATIFSASEIRQDEIFERLQNFKADLLSGDLCIPYHKSCRATYTSKSNND